MQMGHNRMRSEINNNKIWLWHAKLMVLRLQVYIRKKSSSDNEILELSCLVQPYSIEPLASSGDEMVDENETENEDGISSQTLAQRYEKGNIG